MLDTQFTTFFLDLEEVCVTSCSNNCRFVKHMLHFG